MNKNIEYIYIYIITIMLTLISGSQIAWGLESAPGILTKERALSADNYSKIHLNFDKIIQNKFTNTLSDKTPGHIHEKSVQIPGVFGNAMQTDTNGMVTVSCKEFPPELHSFITEFWFKSGKTADDTTILEVTDSNNLPFWQLRLISSQKQKRLIWSIGAPDTPEYFELVSNQSLNDPNRWYRVSISFAPPPGSGGSTALRIYLDGYVVAEKPYFEKISMGPGGILHIRTPHDGAIDELMISERSQEILHEVANKPNAPHNLDFEDGAKGWVGVYDDCTIDKTTFHEGKQSLRLETDGNYTREYLSPMFSVETGATYKVTFWAKVDRWNSGFSSFSLWCRWYFEPEETCSFGGDLVAHCIEGDAPRTFDWKKFSGEVTVPMDESYWGPIRWGRFQIKNYHSNVLVWIDDISLKQIKTKEMTEDEN